MNKIISALLILVTISSYSQQIPSPDEKIGFIVTFGKNGEAQWGDNDHSQVFFFVIPTNEKKPVYLRIFDADISGAHDEAHNVYNTKTRFTVYGGNGAHSDKNNKTPGSKVLKTGIEISSRTFGADASADDKWVTMGPFNPVEGELQPELGGYVFKVVIEGTEGDDGNLYRLFLSSSDTENKAIEGGNSFTYEYCFRLSDTKGSVSHLYPFIAENVVAIKVNVFDYDDDGILRVVSVARKGEVGKSSGNNSWAQNEYKISKEELKTSMDVQFIKQSASKNNNVVVYIANQYNEMMPFFTVPIGGVPKYKFKIGVKPGGK